MSAYVITNLTMPEMTGERLARELKLIMPDIPVILFAKFSEHFMIDRGKESGSKEIVIKPVEIEDLFTIRKVLDETKKRSKK
ncbi:MAG: response regulator [Pseudomonadota bacterium]